MNVPLSWLREFVDIALAPRELADRLTMAGLEVEAVREVGAEWERVYVGVVERVARHPDADRLVLATVAAGAHHLTVVTGAPNIAAGQKVALALVGARLWDGHAEEPKRITLKANKIRGVASEGMVCSEKELGLSAEHEGILTLPEDAPVGVPLRDYLGDTILELEITPNLVHAYSVVGVAREVAALTGRAVQLPTSPPLTPDRDSAAAPAVVEATELCSRYAAAVVEGVTVGESPDWLKQRLALAGLRAINNIADVTNYVMLEWGQPLHAFDRDRLEGGRAIVRRARPGERLETLDHVVRTLDSDMLTIADANKPVGLAGVMGGLASEIGDTTTTVLLEAATFDRYAVRITANRLRLPSDAAARFGRGLDPELVWPALERAVALILELCPTARLGAIADVYPEPARPRGIDFPYCELERLLGITVPVEQAIDVLRRLEFGVELDEVIAGREGLRLRVTVPTWRQDVTGPADLVEEVIRIVGYDTLPATLPTGGTSTPLRDPRRLFVDEVRDLLAATGLHEIVSYSLTDEPTLDRLAPGAVTWTTWWEGDRPSFESTRLVNTLRDDWRILRPTLMAHALSTLAENLKYRTSARLFEARPVYLPRHAKTLPEERPLVAIALGGARGSRSLYDGGAGEPLDFFDLKGIVETLLARLGLTKVSYAPSSYATFQPGRAAEVLVDGVLAGVFGEVHPLVAAAFGLSGRLAVAELDLDALRAKVPVTVRARVVTRHQPTVQDFAIVVDEAIPVGDVQRTILTAAQPLAESARLFDVYRGEQIPTGKKSLAFEVTFTAPDRALADRELARLRERIAGTLHKQLRATIRG